MKLFVTNFSENIINHPIKKLDWFKDKNLVINDGCLEVNESLFYHIFDNVPTVRRIPENESFFKNYLIHKKPYNELR